MRRKIGQALSEYSVFAAIILFAVLAMNVYVKRGLQGKYADVMDSTIAAVRNRAALNVSSQYEPYYEVSDTSVSMPRERNEEIAISYNFKRTFSPDDITRANTASLEGINVENSTVIW